MRPAGKCDLPISPRQASVHVLTAEEKSELQDLARLTEPFAVSGAALATQNLPNASAIPDFLTQWRRDVRTHNIGLLKNLPLDPVLPPTPVEKGAYEHTVFLSNWMILLIARLFGTPFTIAGKLSNQLIHDLYPVRSDEATQLGTSSLSDLDWHVEEAFHPDRPSWLLLLCLRGDVTARTKVARLVDLEIQENLFESLRKRPLLLRIDDTYDGIVPLTARCPIITGSQTDPQIVFDSAYTVCENAQDTELVAIVAQAAEAAKIEIALSPGDCMVFNNRRVLHGRTSFYPRYDGTDRWLKRAFTLETGDFCSGPIPDIIPFRTH